MLAFCLFHAKAYSTVQSGFCNFKAVACFHMHQRRCLLGSLHMGPSDMGGRVGFLPNFLMVKMSMKKPYDLQGAWCKLLQIGEGGR